MEAVPLERPTFRKRAVLAPQYHAVVVGSGVGGLVAANLLAREAGLRVLVLERHGRVGGLTQSFRRGIFEWDVGVHYVGEVHRPGSRLARLFDYLTEGRLTWADVGPVFDRVVTTDGTFDFVQGLRSLEAAFASRFPAEMRGIAAYFSDVRAATADARRLFHGDVHPGGRAAMRGAPRWGTTASVLASRVRDPLLRRFLASQHGDYGVEPDRSSFLAHALLTDHYADGAGYPVGGSARIAETLVPAIVRAGGGVVLGAGVERIFVSAGRARGVRLDDGTVVQAPLVVSGAGMRLTRSLLGADADPGADAWLASVPPSPGHFVLFVGLSGSPDAIGLPKHNLFVDLDDGGAAPEGLAPGRLFVSCGSAKDPEYTRRRPGGSTLTAIVPANDAATGDGGTWMRRTAAYRDRKDQVASYMLALLHRVLPTIEGKVVHTELATPETTRHFTGHPFGESYGLACVPERFASSRASTWTGIEGLFLAGADACTPGVGGAALGGALAASAALGRPMIPFA